VTGRPGNNLPGGILDEGDPGSGGLQPIVSGSTFLVGEGQLLVVGGDRVWQGSVGKNIFQKESPKRKEGKNPISVDRI